jgi:hypothetical protein
MGLSSMRRASRPRHQCGDQYQEGRAIPAEMEKNYRVGRPESHAYEKSATALSVGIPRHNAKRLAAGECQYYDSGKLTGSTGFLRIDLNSYFRLRRNALASFLRRRLREGHVSTIRYANDSAITFIERLK